MLKILAYSTYYQILMFLRIKQAVFFSLVFPVGLFILFSNIWGADSQEYIVFILTGVIGMTAASDGMFAVGPVIKQYYTNNFIKYLRKLPFNILIHFGALAISRFFVLLWIIAVLVITAYLFFEVTFQAGEVLNLLLGGLAGLIVFSFLGLVLSFLGIRSETEKGVINLVYFGMLFTSDCFYPASTLNPVIGHIGNVFPLNSVLHLIRGESVGIWLLLSWLLGGMFLFYVLFKRLQIKR